MITYKDCPECGARKIHSTVRLCEVCETCEKYESKLAGEAAHIKSLEGLLVDATRERDEARDELAKTSADFHDVWESRDKVIEERERARQACNAYWHDLTRIALLCAQTDDEYPLKAVERTVRERDEALAQVARREREHEALLETAQKALAHAEADAEQAVHNEAFSERQRIVAYIRARLAHATMDDRVSMRERGVMLDLGNAIERGEHER